ncbi:hypothetical protein ABZZ79_31300 [Streptomyces sp. NPDC006458]|uniref:hypothetical protein n=1 Tax=Streptomyces sp. NPDC006458 TaxID=3154302 RepID=UPI00339E7E78
MSGTTGAGRMRLLPFGGPDGKRAYLSSDGPDSFLNRFADLLEARQLDMGARMLVFAREALERPGLDERELRWLSERLCEALTDALRVAESREREQGSGACGAPQDGGDASQDGGDAG